jgi:hypothetical protein
MTTAEQLQQDMQNNRAENELFFKKHEPSIYKLIEGKKFSYTDLKIITKPNSDELELDCIEKGVSRYFEAGKYYCREESEKFLKQMKSGTPIPNYTATNPDQFLFDRIGSIHLNQLACEINEKVSFEKPLTLPDFYPMLVIMGTGLAEHIKNVVETREIGSLIIYENDMDRFLVSLYTINWQSIYDKFNVNNGQSIQFIICQKDNYHAKFGFLWNAIINYVPQFPFTAIFYNHLNDATNEKIIKDIHLGNVSFINQWGHYDDEINQYNNARHNLLLGAKLLRPSTFKINRHIPVAIIASGPSLDDKIDLIKKYEKKLLIISCGTALGSLFTNNIKPDFHIELESDFLVYETIKKSTSASYRKGITLLASAQANPKALTLFDESLIFFKDSTALSSLFISDDEDIITHTTPTCTNAGIAFATKLKFKNIFLFGADFGFKDLENHHSSESIYYKEHAPKELHIENSADLESTTTTIDVKGQIIHTKPMYLVSKIRLEECIKFSHYSEMSVYNCSDGSAIKNSHWISSNKLDKILNNSDVAADPKKLAHYIYKNSDSINVDDINAKSQFLLDIVDTTFKTVMKRKPKESTFKSISEHLFVINNITTIHSQNKFSHAFYFLRGHFWLYITMYYTAALNASSTENLDEIQAICDKWLQVHHKIIMDELKYILFHTMDINEDPWINSTVEKLEVGTRKWENIDHKTKEI